VNNDYILFEVNIGMYGLPQAGLLAQQQLISHLANHGYHQTPDTPFFFVMFPMAQIFLLSLMILE
jgi:hypothetical protein